MKAFFRNKIFLRQFLSFFLIICVTFLAISFTLLSVTDISLEEQQLNAVGSYRIKASKELQRWLNEREYTVKNQALYLSQLMVGKIGSPEVDRIIRQQLAWDVNFYDFLILDEKGNVVNSKDQQMKDINLSSRPYFRAGIKGESTITSFYKAKRGNLPILAIAEPIFIEGKPRYVLAGLITLQRVKQIVEDLKFGEWGHAYLVNDQGMFITDSRFIDAFMNSEKIQSGEHYQLDSRAIQALLQKRAGTSKYTDFRGQEVFGSYEWLDSLKVGLVIEFNEKETMEPTRDLLGIIKILALLVIVAAAIMSFFLSKRIIGPLRVLVDTTESIIKCNYQEPIKIKTDGELDILVKNFNRMQAAIQIREKELQKKNEALKEQMVEVNEANRLKSQFLANMSHELRTPLNSIIGFTTRVIKKSGDKLPAVQLENLAIVKEEAEHLLELINGLLDYSKIEAGKMEVHLDEFDLTKVVTEVHTMAESLIGDKPVNYEEEFCFSGSISLYSDRTKVKQILINLLSNAFKYSDQGTVKLSICQERDYYQIRIQDQGIGIAPEHLERIFDEFRQVDGSYTRKVGGTGLGLSITKRFVELLQGKIEVESTLGVGSCFTVYLPVRYQGHQMEAEEDQSNYQSSEYRKKVICIDDDFNVQRLYKQYLDEHGFKVIPFDGREEIIPKVLEIMPDAILLDIMLPYRDGWEILADLKDNPLTRTIPVIMMSVLSERNLAYRMRADEYLIKPVSQEELLNTINRTTLNREGLDVLVVDDDENYLNLLSQILKEESIGHRVAKDGEEALQRIMERKPDLLLLDLMMPKKDGFAVIEEIKKREEWKDIAIIVLTAKSLSNKEKGYLRERANFILEKSGNHIEQVMEYLLKRMKEGAEGGEDSLGRRPTS